jgi:hypothetical protein
MNNCMVDVSNSAVRSRESNFAAKVLRVGSFAALLFLGVANLCAQIAVAPPAPVVALRSAPDLETMVGPIALYPDPLIAQILPAATLPAQIVMANRYVTGGYDLNQIDLQPWDQSVKAVARYPDVLRMMDSSLDWTTALGQAFLYQPQDVMNAIQRLRSQALALGNLQSTAQQQVISDNGILEILPANPTVVYVPVYEPNVVFYQRRPLNGFYVSFGHGFSIGAWLNHDLDWYHHNVIVWGPGHARPTGWWKEPPRQRFQDVRVVQDYRVWQPRNHEIHGDRGWDRTPVHREPAPAPRIEPRPQPKPQAPVRAEPWGRPANGALIGVDSAHNTRDYSNRGHESRSGNRPVARNPEASRAAPLRSAPDRGDHENNDKRGGDHQPGRK